MRFFTDSRAGLGLIILPFAAAHSWVEAVYRVDPSSRKYIGAPGFPRGGSFRRMSIEEGLQDGDYIHRVPDAGGMTGEELMNKDPMSTKGPENEILEVAPGDFIAIQHLENGHVSLVDEGRPLNSGTIFIYGTAEPTDQDKISDIHLKWNQDGSGGDGRGRLLATRNYNDGQCYEGNAEKDVPQQRAKELKTDPLMSLPCQSDIKLPDDLQPNSQYTIYWYWDWPMLNIERVDMEATRDGKFPWSGTHKQGMGADQDVVVGEGYTSTVDLKVVSKGGVSTKADGSGLPEELGNQPDVYSQAIEGQMESNFAVEFQSYEDGGNAGEPLPDSQVPEHPVQTREPQADKETVTVTKTVTEPASQTPCSPTATQTVTELETQLTTVWADAPTTMVTSTRTGLEDRALPSETTTIAARDASWDWKAAARGLIVRPRNV